MYAVHGGCYMGENLVYMRETVSSYHFLALPDNNTREVPKDKFEFALKESIIGFIQQIPKKYWLVCKTQYEKNLNNRRKQPPIQELVDSQD
tara:strand:+ start:5450 stop:5722 length:273 start_codon:yes stop_codon:yes gene_type:complete